MKKAFSLMELLIVLLILGLLAGLVLPRLAGQGERAKEETTCLQMKTLENTLKMFKTDNSVFPSTTEGLKALQTNPSTEKYPKYLKAGYMEKLPKDAWSRDFVYVNNSGTVEIISFGADGSESTDDIKLSTCEK